METLPNWFWILYYLFLLITLGTAIFSIVKRKMTNLAMIAIIFTIIIPIITLANSIGRAEGTNEFEHILSQFQQGAVWSIIAIIGYIFLLVWWILFLFKLKRGDGSRVSS